MYDPSIDYFINVRPQYLQDGGKKPDIYTHPCGLRAKLQSKFGTFPLHKFWGPATGIEASKWIADSSVAVDIKYNPTLTFIYLPHMDYSLQKKGPSDRKDVAADLRQIDNVVKNLVTYYEGNGASVIILSEYGISPVTTPVYINRELRRAGFLQVRQVHPLNMRLHIRTYSFSFAIPFFQECGGETLDCGASRAFALCDHQVRTFQRAVAHDLFRDSWLADLIAVLGAGSAHSHSES
jgi:predicted AlkP superfamily pyrophosphatase or phosphodiesterase